MASKETTKSRRQKIYVVRQFAWVYKERGEVLLTWRRNDNFFFLGLFLTRVQGSLLGAFCSLWSSSPLDEF